MVCYRSAQMIPMFWRTGAQLQQREVPRVSCQSVCVKANASEREKKMMKDRRERRRPKPEP